MSGQGYTITFTTGLIEKLAGIKKQEEPKPAAWAPPGGSLAGMHGQRMLTPDTVALIQSDAHLARALQASRRVGKLLLKAEDEEAIKVNEYAEELLKQHSFPVKPVPCQSEHDECAKCYAENPQDPLKCASIVDAYSKCANAAFDAYVRATKQA